MITNIEDITEINYSLLFDELRKESATNNSIITNFQPVLPEEVNEQQENYVVSVIMTSSRMITLKTTTTTFHIVIEENHTQATLENEEGYVLMVGTPEKEQENLENEFASAVISYINSHLG